MMRVLLLSLVLGLSFTANFAKAAGTSNPAIRACRVDGGVYYGLIPQGGTIDNALWMCFFDNSAIGAEEFFLFKSSQGESQAIQAYRYNSGSDCESVGAETVVATNESGKAYNICQFSDESMIDAKVLKAGPGAPQNKKLDLALSATY